MKRGVQVEFLGLKAEELHGPRAVEKGVGRKKFSVHLLPVIDGGTGDAGLEKLIQRELSEDRVVVAALDVAPSVDEDDQRSGLVRFGLPNGIHQGAFRQSPEVMKHEGRHAPTRKDGL